MIEVKHLSKKIGKKQVLQDVSFTVGKGSVTGIVGRNGAGKTTLLKTMVTILDPDKGGVELNGQSLFLHPEAKRTVLYVSDSVEVLKSYSIQHIVSLYADIYPNFDQEYFHELMARFNMPAAKKVKHYSKGRKALFALILAFSARPEYILLDEPTDGLDVVVKKQLLRFLLDEVAKEGVSVLIATHRLDELETLADQVLVMKDGKIAETFQLDELRETYRKWQIVYREEMPTALFDKLYMLQQSGRVYTCLAEGDLETLEADIKQSDPLLYEELPLTLEDVFVAKLGGEQIAE
ncbi:ABC transporter, ATP-binding protein [Geomicrobium sp. JCM 19037]|uniref:ABC transporter ATP-binding protein n=1 Tax=unclassified Geomicrobium TaxID=2628951 RepID=UPI00045F4973|nr:ABC transporter ATP-binding protein [Geomicrobium sp. JCM 19037]GAK02094.1 ABC transporter, ATP-binding protein [Geomicrobium sp. JCM 19037]